VRKACGLARDWRVAVTRLAASSFNSYSCPLTFIAMPGRTLNADSAAMREKVTTAVPRILDQAQISSANHQKNLVALYKVQTEAAQYTESVRRGKEIRLIGERIFEEAILTMLMLVLPVKKGTAPADRIIKFISGYIKFVHEKGVCSGISSPEWCLLIGSCSRRREER
jgi:hypothetical protein